MLITPSPRPYSQDSTASLSDLGDLCPSCLGTGRPTGGPCMFSASDLRKEATNKPRSALEYVLCREEGPRPTSQCCPCLWVSHPQARASGQEPHQSCSPRSHQPWPKKAGKPPKGWVFCSQTSENHPHRCPNPRSSALGQEEWPPPPGSSLSQTSCSPATTRAVP